MRYINLRLTYLLTYLPDSLRLQNAEALQKYSQESPVSDWRIFSIYRLVIIHHRLATAYEALGLNQS